MRSRRRWIIMLIGVLAFGFLATGVMGEIVFESIDYSLPAIQIANDFLNALESEDDKKAWEFLTELTQSGLGDFKNFKDWCLEHPDIRNCKLKEQVSVTANKLIVVVLPPKERIPGFGGFYLIKQDGKWKIGLPGFYFEKIEADTEILRRAIENYYIDNKRLPYILSELISPVSYIKSIPSDPFNERSEPYVYTVAGNEWELYSYGPDGDDDLGIKECGLRGPLCDGDIIVRKEIK